MVESYVAKCDMEIEGETIKKGTWLMTMEITDSDVWDSIQKGDITGFSMGGVGVYSEEDVELPVEKQEEPKGLFRKLAKAMGFDVVEKGAVKNNFKRRVKEDNFYSAWYALRSCLEGNFYNPDTLTRRPSKTLSQISMILSRSFLRVMAVLLSHWRRRQRKLLRLLKKQERVSAPRI